MLSFINSQNYSSTLLDLYCNYIRWKEKLVFLAPSDPLTVETDTGNIEGEKIQSTKWIIFSFSILED